MEKSLPHNGSWFRYPILARKQGEKTGLFRTLGSDGKMVGHALKH